MSAKAALPRIRPARASDRAALEALLAAASLPLAGLGDHLASTLVAEADGGVVGSVALELYGEHALLRSLAVDRRWRATGLGARLIAEALALAEGHGVCHVWLLTTTAEEYFPRFGFVPVPRTVLPAALDRSEELRGACPDSAVSMHVVLPRDLAE